MLKLLSLEEDHRQDDADFVNVELCVYLFYVFSSVRNFGKNGKNEENFLSVLVFLLFDRNGFFFVLTKILLIIRIRIQSKKF